MKINGVTLNLNVADADKYERYEKAVNSAVEKIRQITDDMSGSQMIRVQCHAVFDCFNELFGEGTDRKLFGEKTDLLKCIKAFGELVSQVNREGDKLKGEIEKLGASFRVKK